MLFAGPFGGCLLLSRGQLKVVIVYLRLAALVPSVATTKLSASSHVQLTCQATHVNICMYWLAGAVVGSYRHRFLLKRFYISEQQ